MRECPQPGPLRPRARDPDVPVCTARRLAARGRAGSSSSVAWGARRRLQGLRRPQVATRGHEAAGERAKAEKKAADARGGGGGRLPGPREAGAWWDRRGGGVWRGLEAALAI